MKRVYIAVINDLVTDQRLQRVASLLAAHDFEVTCIGRHLRESLSSKDLPFKTKRFRMIFTRGPLFYACFNFRLFCALLLSRNPALLIANDLDTLPSVFLTSRLRKIPLIYDSHELFTQVPELIHRKRTQRIWKGIEGLLLPRIRNAVTVSYPIAEIYRRLYGVRFKVVRNVPRRIEKPVKRQLPSEFQGKQLIIYQGALNVGRGLELMIEAMHFLENTKLLIVGQGDIEEELKAKAEKEGLDKKIDFLGRISPDDLAPLTAACDLGISLEEDMGLNYRYALPNKLFDYIQARIPVLCSALPEMARIVETYGVGIATRERNPEQLASIVRYMLKERSAGAWLDALEKASEVLCWEAESEIYLDLIIQSGVLQ